MLHLTHETIPSIAISFLIGKAKATEFYELLVTVTKEDQVNLVAYKGASIALHAKQSKKVKDKKELFLEGVSYIEFAIKKEPDAIEPRFVRLTIQENTPKLLKYKRNIEEDKTVIFVSDNGSGIDENILNQIFIPFYTTKKKGSGIGLSLSKNIMKKHGGNLLVNSEKNKHTTFSLVFKN